MRFISDVLNGVPSIVIGIVAYGLVVMRQKHFSALAGGVALAIMMVPTIARTTEQMLLLVPQAIREAAFGLGSFPMAYDNFDYAAYGDLRGYYWCYARICPGSRRNRAAAIHGVRKPVLELEVGPADGGVVAADFHLCDFALR